MRWGIVARVAFTVAFLVSGLFISNNSLQPDNAIAQSSPVTIYSCDELLSKLRQVANGSAVAAVDNCTIVNNKIRAVVRMNQETCVIFNSLPYCQNSPNDAWINTVQSSNRTLIRDIIKNPEPTGNYVAKCGNEHDPWIPLEVNWICRSDRAINGNTQTITTRTWLTISPRPTTTITADKTSVTIGHPTFMLSWQAQFADNIRLQKSSDGNNWQEYQGYGYNLTPPTSGSQIITAQGSYNSIVHQYFRTVSTNVYNQQGFGQNDRAGYSNTLDITVSPIGVTLTADPATVIAGNSSTLSWTSEGADTLAIDNGIGNVAVPSGSKSVAPQDTTTYTITARAQSGVTATATATVTVICDEGGGDTGFIFGKARAATCLPDLVIDISSASVEVQEEGKSNNRIFTTSFNALPAGIGNDTSNHVEIKGLKIKNQGNATARGKICLKVYATSAWGSLPFCLNDGNPTTISAGSSKTVNHTGVLISEIGKDQRIAALQTRNNLELTVDPDNRITEVDETNNKIIVDHFLAWGIIRVKIGNYSKLSAVVEFKRHGKAKWVKASTNSQGVALLGLTDALYDGPVTYDVRASLGGRIVDTGSVTVDKYSVHNLSLRATPKLVMLLRGRFEFVVDGPISEHQDNKMLSGMVAIGNIKTEKEINIPIKNGVGILFDNEIEPGTYAITHAQGRFRDDLWYYSDPLGFLFPEPTRNGTDNGLQSFEIKTGESALATWDLFLGKECADDRGTRFCIYSDQPRRQQFMAEVLPQLKSVARRMKDWPSYSARLGSVEISPDPNYKAAGVYFPGRNGFKKGQDLVINEYHGDRGWNQTILYHEEFHEIDDYYGGPNGMAGNNWVSNNTDYRRSVDKQILSDTGRKIWDIAIAPFAYDNILPGYPSKILQTSSSGGRSVDRYSEVLADQYASLCYNKQAVVDRLNNISVYWTKIYKTAPPSDLTDQRDNALNRLKGIVPTARGGQSRIPALAAWYNDCLNH